MIYERVIRLRNGKCYSLYQDRIFEHATSEEFDQLKFNPIEVIKRSFFENDIFCGNIFDLVLELNISAQHHQKRIYILRNSDGTFFILPKNIVIAFIVRFANKSKYRGVFHDILTGDIEGYFFHEPHIPVTPPANILSVRMDGDTAYLVDRKGNPLSHFHMGNSVDFHLQKLRLRITTKPNNKKFFQKIIRHIGDFGVVTYIFGYKIGKLNTDGFLLHPNGVDQLGHKPIISKGIDINPTLSLIKGFMEGIERYSMVECAHDRLKSIRLTDTTRTKINEFLWNFLGKNISLDSHARHFSAYLCYFIEKIDKLSIRLKKTSINIPVEFVISPKNHEGMTPSCNSNGISAHQDYYRAFMNSYLEIIERDAIALTHYFRLAPLKIKVDDMRYFDCIKALEEKYGYDLYFLDISYDTPIHIVLCIGVNREEKVPFAFFGCGSGLLFKEAFDKALSETSYLIDTSMRNDFTDIIRKREQDLNDLKIADTKDHILYYTLPTSFLEVKYLFENSLHVLFSEKKNCTKKRFISMANEDKIAISDLTARFSRKNGFYILKVFSKKYIPFWFGKMENLPIPKIMERFQETKEFLITKGIFLESRKKRYTNTEKDFLHFLG